MTVLTARSDRTLAASSPSADRTHRGHDPYDGLEPILAELAGLAPADPYRARLRDELIRRCLPLADHIARRYSGRGIDFDDLLQIARVGVVNAVDRFDPSAGTPFLAFAVPTVLGEVRRYFRDQGWAVRVPRRLKELRTRIGAVTPGLTPELGRTPGARDLAAALGISVEEITQAVIAANGYSSDSLESTAPANGSGDAPISLTDRLGSADPHYELLEDAAAVRPLLGQLPATERRILILRYFDNKTQGQIAEMIGCSQMQVSRILKRVLTSLREQALDEPATARAA